MSDLVSLVLTTEFLNSLTTSRFTAADHAAILKALVLLDENEQHQSLRVHRLHGNFEGDAVGFGERLVAPAFLQTERSA